MLQERSQVTRKKVLTSAYRLTKVGVLPLCWKAFLENPTPHQQHWAASRCPQATTLYAIGWCHLVIYLLQLDGVNSLFADCCALRVTRQLCLLLRPSWDQMAVVHLRGGDVTPYIVVTFRHGVSLATSFVTVYLPMPRCFLCFRAKRHF